MNISKKLIVTFLAVFIIPMLMIGGLFFHEAEMPLKNARIAELEGIADLKVKLIQKFLSGLRKDAVIAQDYFNIKTNLPLMTRFAHDRKNPAYLKAKQKLDGQLKPLQRVKGFEDIMLVSPEGMVVYVTSDAHEEIDLDMPLPDSRAFEEGKKGVHLSNILITKGKYAHFEMLVTAPMHGLDGSFIGVVTFEINIEPVHALMRETMGRAKTGETLIALNNGDHALFLNPLRYDAAAAMNRRVSFGDKKALSIQKAVQGRSGSGITIDYRGEEIIAAWRHIPSMNWGLVAKIDTAEAFASVNTLRNLALTIGVIVLLIMTLIAMAVARSFSRPIENLKDGIALIGRGNLDHRVGTESKDEIGQLARAFDEMTASLKTTTASRDELETEIAVRKQVESALRNSEAKVSAIVNNLVDGVISIDEKGMVESLNPSAERIFGYSPDEVIGKNVNMLMPEPYRSQHDGYLANYLKTGDKKIIGIGREVEGRRKDGSTFPLELAVSEIIIGDQRRFVGTLRDITERRQMETAIHETDARLKKHHDAYATLAQNKGLQRGRLTSALKEITEATSHALGAGRVSVWQYDEKDGICCLDLFEQGKRTHSKGVKLAARDYPSYFKALSSENIIAADDAHTDPRTCEFSENYLSPLGITSMLDAPVRKEEKTVGVLCIEHTGPVRKWMSDEQQFARSVADLVALALEVHERKKAEDEIGQKNIQLEQASRMKSEFLANMSHELRTPLNAIIGFSEVLKDGVMGKMTKDQAEYINDIFNSGQHLLELINDILDLSKIEAGRMELDLEQTEIAGLLHNSMGIIKEKAMAHHIKLDLDIGEDVGDCCLDARKIKQIIYNLLSNAVKFTPDGGKITLAARKLPRTELPADTSSKLTAQENDFLEISVADTGIGISKDDLGGLFQPFTQADSSLSRKFEGTGLGLVMVKRLAELHEGAVGVESEPEHGSTFTVWLPYRETGSGLESRTDRKMKQAVRDSRPDPLSSDRLSVLIVEDEDKAADLMRIQLEDDGYRTMRASSAEQALDMLAETKPDLITLDILLPGMDGWDFLAEIKKNKGYANIPVVIVSIVADEKKGFSLGASQVLQKPIRKKTLLAAVAGIGVTVGQPIRALVVDDDPRAVDFVCRHLEESQNCTVSKAYGGAEAIDMAGRELPDFIVLDLMMPEVSGFDVVDALKTQKKTAAIPIIILTAKVVTGEDRARLNGSILKILEKSEFNHGSFMAEVNRALQPEARAAPRHAPPVEKQAAQDAVRNEGGKPVILVVEDEARDGELLEIYLADAGYTVLHAEDGRTALAMMQQHRPDLITLDVMMPEMSGFEFLNEKGKLAEFADIPVLVVSGVTQVEKGLTLGAHAILTKPFKRKALLDTIANLGIHSADDKARHPAGG